MKPIPVDAVESMRDVTLTVTIKRGAELRLRIAAGKWLIRLAAWVINCNIIVDEMDIT